MDIDRIPITLPLNAFLLRAGWTPKRAMTDTAAEVCCFYLVGDGRLELLGESELELVDALVAGDVVLALLRKPCPAPGWQRFVHEEFGLDVIASRDSLGALIFCALDDCDGRGRTRWMAWAFGSGSRSLQRRSHDPRFGMMVVLNSLADPNAEEGAAVGAAARTRGPRVRELRYRSPAPYVQQTGHRAARDIPVDGFRIDRSTDLLSTVGTTGASPLFATSTLRGGRSLSFRAPVTQVSDLVEFSGAALAQSRLSSYRGDFPWVDNIRPVEDEAVIDQLKAHVADTLADCPESIALDAILPDDLLEVGDDRSICTIALPGERGNGGGRLTLTTAVLASQVARLPQAERARGLDRHLRFYDDAQAKIGEASVLECLSAEFQIDGDHYIAYDGDFFQVFHDYVKVIDDELARVPESSIEFPTYRGEPEPDYNAKVGHQSPAEFVNLDRELIRIPGETPFEACDLIATTGAMVHVKRKGKSSALSHLFLQAANSCEMLRRSAAAQERLGGVIDSRCARPDTAKAIKSVVARAVETRGELEVVFAFLGDWKDRSIGGLPLFSRISLVNACKRVHGLGFRATVKTLSYR